MKKLTFLILGLLVFTGCTQSKVELVGWVSNVEWQHMIELQEGYDYIEYVDFEDGNQMVVYSKDPIECPNNVKLVGNYIEVAGESKRPDSVEMYTETQFIADEIECVD